MIISIVKLFIKIPSIFNILNYNYTGKPSFWAPIKRKNPQKVRYKHVYNKHVYKKEEGTINELLFFLKP